MKHFLVLLTFSLITSAIAGQTGTFRGFVLEKENEAPIPYANITLKGTKIGKSSDINGFYQITEIPVGTYTAVFSFLGFETIEVEIKIRKDRITTLKVYMEPATQLLDDVVINVERQEQKTKIMTSVVTLSPKKIQQFSVGGDPDLVRALQVLPGVITSGDQGGQLYIRGGAPIQNLVLLDGMIIYNPFHSIGFFSVFDTDILQSADVYTAGFGAQYGSRNSSVMDVRTRDGNRQKFSGTAYASTYMAKLLLEAPIGKKRANGFAPMSFLVSAKTSYLDQTSSIFYPYVETAFGDGLPFTFTDIYGKFSVQATNGSRLGIYGFSFSDAVNLDSQRSIVWNSWGVGGNFKVIPPASSTIIEGAFAVSDYQIESTELVNQPRSSSINGFNLGLDFTYFVRENDEIKYGIQAIGYATDYVFTNSLGLQNNEQQNTTELGAYAQYRFVSTRFLIEPGFRVQYYGSLAELSLEPRIGLKYNITENFRFKAAAGLYSQNLVAANSDRDVVNLFYGFLSGPENVPSDFRGEPITSRLQKAAHLVGGFEIGLGKQIDINIEGYLKDFQQLTNVNRNKLYPDVPAYSDKPEILRKDFIIEKGFAYGFDFLLKYYSKDYSLWAAYSWSKVTRDDGIQEYNPFFDRRHNLNIVASYFWGRDKEWEASVRWNYGSGFPFTQTQGFYPEIGFVDPNTGRPAVDFDYTTENGEGGILYGNLNGGRLPEYHRLDLSVKRIFKLRNNARLEAAAGATNVYNRENIFFFDRVNAQRVDQLPIMPTVSITYAW
jgi:hypothetical protein